MKRIAALIIAFAVTVMPFAYAATSITTVYDFEIRFGAAALITGSGHYLNSTNDTRGDGEVNDIIQAMP